MPSTAKAAQSPASANANVDADMLDLQPEHVRQTRAQIENFVGQIAAAGKTLTDHQAFFDLALDRLQQAMGASSVGLWRQRSCHDELGSSHTWTAIASRELPESLCNDFAAATNVDASEHAEGQIELAQALLLQATLDDQSASLTQPTASTSLSRLLDCVDREGTAVLVPPSTVDIPGIRPSNPTNQSLIFAPIHDEKSGVIWWLQVAQNPAGGPATHRGYLRFCRAN